MSGTNQALKYGAPTDSLPPVSASQISGASVPSATRKVDTISSRLFARMPTSRDSGAKRTEAGKPGARRANSNSAPPTMSTRSASR
jgi:hypothetical protein